MKSTEADALFKHKLFISVTLLQEYIDNSIDNLLSEDIQRFKYLQILLKILIPFQIKSNIMISPPKLRVNVKVPLQKLVNASAILTEL